MLRASILTAGAALALAGTAGAQTPAQGVARQLKASMAAHYKTTSPEIKFTTVTCKIAADRSSARCLAHFVDAPKRTAGVFTVMVTETAAGTAQAKTLGVACKDSKTGSKVSCF